MKRIILLICLICSFSYSASAQISGGIKGGLNFANIDTDSDPDGKTGYHAGVYLNVGMAGISLQPEILYSVKGAEDFEVTYIDIPIVLQKKFAKVLNIHLGPQFSFLTKAEGITEIDLGSGAITKGDVKDQLKSSDLSLLFGAGVNLPGGLSGGLRYIIGLSDVNDKYFDFGGGAPEIKNKTFQIYVGYKLFGN